MAEMKEQWKQWTSPGERAPKKAQTVPSAGKVMAIVFWDSQGIFTDYLEKGSTITGQYYAEKTAPFGEEKCALSPWQRTSWLSRNCHSKTGRITPHPPYSPDLAPCDLYLFPNMKKGLGGKRFTSKEEVIAANKSLFCGVRQTIFFGWLEKVRLSLY